jgi:hypothetical protein
MDDGDPFAPLSAAELATGTASQSKDDGTDELVAPVPPEAPNPPRAHPQWGKPTAYWTYRGANGTTLQIVFRFDPPGSRKQFLPCTLWRDAKGLRWRWKGLPTPRPLYGLEMLADNPDAVVIVCEGEKSADAAQIIFPDHVAITSPGGSLAADKADWGPLAGRHVIIWPDNDEPGAKYVLEVAAILTGLGCKVTVIDANALASVDAGGRGPDWTADGWDAADALVGWSDVETLRSGALGLTKPYEAANVAATTIAEIKSAATILNKDDIDGVELLIEAGVVAKASRIEADQIIKTLAKSLGVPKAGVVDLWRRAEHRARIRHPPTVEDLPAQREPEGREREGKRAEIYERCKHIATNSRLLDAMADLAARLGVVSERRAISATYLTATSRLIKNHAISLLRRGAAASGKNHVADAVFKLIPPESIVTAVGGSPKALAYFGGVEAVDALKHKLLYIPEAAAIADRHGVESEFTTMLRVLISEGRIVYQTVHTQEGSPPVTVTVTKNGPIAVVITSARANIEEEMMTRLMVVDADESDDQTRAIIERILTESHHPVSADELERWRDFQRWLELGRPYEVHVPFLSAILRARAPQKKTPLRYRRDISNFITAIKASAIVYSAQRKRDGLCRIVANLGDYEAAHAAFDRDMGSLYSVNVPDTIKAVVRAIEDMVQRERFKGQADEGLPADSAKVTYDGLMTALGINSNDTAGRRLKEALRLGLIEQVEPPGGSGKTTARRYRVLVHSIDLEKCNIGGVFPSPDAVCNAVQSENCTGYTACTVVSEGEGEALSGLGAKAPYDQKEVEIAPPRRMLRGTI